MNLLIGDSHICCLENYNKKYNNELYQFSAASIRGLINTNSISQTRTKILNLFTNNKYLKIFIMFGKVDIEWIYPYKCKNKNIDFNEYVTDIINIYIEFINELSLFVIPDNIYILGLHLPSLNESDMLKCINSNSAINDVSSKANIDIDIHPIKKIGSLKERTNQICFFNNILKEKIYNINKYNYIDITDELFDYTTNTCKKELVSNMDHHLIRNQTGLIWFNKHLNMLFS